MPHVALIDYGSGNLRSAEKALARAAGESDAVQEIVVTRDPAIVAEAERIVLPGVGAFGDCVRSLADSGMWDATLEWAKSGKPFFGICVGYQMLFDSSEEAPGQSGLGLFKGEVKRFSDVPGQKIPQIGWNTVEVKQPDNPLLAGVSNGDFVYYVHSYYVKPNDPSLVALETTYNDTFAAAIARDNLIATQFHPEKSQRAGLQLLKNFVALATPNAVEPAVA